VYSLARSVCRNNQRRRWPVISESSLRPLYDQELSDYQIGERLGVSHSTVQRHRKKLGWPTKGRGGKPSHKKKTRKQKPIAVQGSGLGDWPNAKRVDSQSESRRKRDIARLKAINERVIAGIMERQNA